MLKIAKPSSTWVPEWLHGAGLPLPWPLPWTINWVINFLLLKMLNVWSLFVTIVQTTLTPIPFFCPLLYSEIWSLKLHPPDSLPQGFWTQFRLCQSDALLHHLEVSGKAELFFQWERCPMGRLQQMLASHQPDFLLPSGTWLCQPGCSDDDDGEFLLLGHGCDVTSKPSECLLPLLLRTF